MVARAGPHPYLCVATWTYLWPSYYLYINNTDYPPIIQEASHSRGFRCLSRALCTLSHLDLGNTTNTTNSTNTNQHHQHQPTNTTNASIMAPQANLDDRRG